MIFYVACDGNDKFSGTLPEPNNVGTDGPFATISRARDEIRKLKTTCQLTDPIDIVIRKGRYFLNETLVLTDEDSGTPQAPITYRAQENEEVVISGGRKIAGWEKAEGELWQAKLSKVRTGRWYFRQLFVDGMRRSRSRLPAGGGLYDITGVLDPNAPLDMNFQTPQGMSNDNHKGFRFTPGKIKPCDLDNLEVVTMHPFAATRMRIAELDNEAGWVKFTGDEYIWSYSTDKKFYLENLSAGLTEAGMWYLDGKAGIVKYWPEPKEDMNSADVIAPVLEFIIRLEGNAAAGRFVEHVIFRDLKFQHAGWTFPEDGFRDPQAAVGLPGAIHADGTRHCSFEHNEFSHIGNYAIEFERGCQNNRITANKIYDIGAGGIKIGEKINRPKDIDETSGMEVTDNHIFECGKVFPEGVGIWIGQSSNNLIAHNEIHDLHYTGISAGWNWYFTRNRTRDNIIEYNHIHHVMKDKLEDGGAIYTLGIAPGTKIRNNYIHHVFGKRPNYTYGIYLDEGSMGILVENNVVHHFTEAGIRLQIATGGNIIMNNIIAFGRSAQFGLDTDRTNSILCNIFYWNEGSLFTRETIDEFETVIDQNIYFDASGRKINFGGRTFEQWQQMRPRAIKYVSPGPVDAESLVADPLFADPDKNDFTLLADSPALKIGFRPIDISTVGPR